MQRLSTAIGRPAVRRSGVSLDLVLVSLAIASLLNAHPSQAAGRRSENAYGGKVDLSCVSSVDLTGGQVHLPKGPGNTHMGCKTVEDDGTTLLTCGGRYIVDRPGEDDVLSLGFKLDKTVDAVNYIVARIESSGKASISFSSDENGDKVIGKTAVFFDGPASDSLSGGRYGSGIAATDSIVCKATLQPYYIKHKGCPIETIKPRPNKVLKCSPTDISTLNITDQTSDAFYMNWKSQETRTDSRYYVECDTSPGFDSGTKQVSSISIQPAAVYRSGEYLTVSSFGLRPASAVANTRDDYFVWWKTSSGDTGPLSGASKILVVDTSNITTAGEVCNAVVAALVKAGIATNITETVPSNVVRATCTGAGGGELNIEQLTSGAVPLEKRLHRGTVSRIISTSSVVAGTGSVGNTVPEYATLAVTGTSVTKGASTGGANITNGSPTGLPSNGNWYIGNAKKRAWEYFYIYNNGGCVDRAVVSSANATGRRVDVSGLTTKLDIANAIATVANSIDGLSATVTNDIPTLQTYTIQASARSRLLDGSQFFLVDETGKIWTWFFDKSGTRTSPLTAPSSPSGAITRIDISNPTYRTTANELAVTIRDAINAVPGVPFNASITVPFKTPTVSVTQNAPSSPPIRGRVTITMADSATLGQSIGGIIPLTSVDNQYFRICLESEGKLDTGSAIGLCTKDVTAVRATIEIEIVAGATKEKNALALTTALNTPANYPGSIVPFVVEQGIGSNADKVFVWQRSAGVNPTRVVVTISADQPNATPDGMSFILASQDGSFVAQFCYEKTTGTCGAETIKVTRDDSYIRVRAISSGSDPIVTVDVGHGLVNDSLVVFIETNDSGGGTSSKLAQRGFRVVSKSVNQFKLVSHASVTTTSAGTNGRVYKAADASVRVSDATADTNADGTFTKTGHGLANDDVVFFTGEASSVTKFAGGKLCQVASVNSVAGTFKCAGTMSTASETGIAFYKVADDSTKIAVASVSVGANPTITTIASHQLNVGDIIIYPFPRNAMSQLVDGGVWQHKFFRVVSVPSSTTLTVTPSITTTTTAAGYIFRGVSESKTNVAHGFKRLMDAHAVFPLHFETYIHDVTSFDKLRVIHRKNGTVPSLYQHKITDQDLKNAPSGMRIVLFDVANNNRKIDICIEHTIIGSGGQCEPSTDPSKTVVEAQLALRLSSVSAGSNPTVTMIRSAHGLLNDRLITFFAVDGGGATLNQRGFKVTGLSDKSMSLLPQISTSGSATKGIIYDIDASRKIAANATANADTTFTGPNDPSGVTGNDDVIYIPGSATAGTSFNSGVVCVVGLYDAHNTSADTWTCNSPRAASGTNIGIDYYVISTSSKKKTVSTIGTGTSPLITFASAHGLVPGQLVVVEVMAGLLIGEVALFKNKIFRVLAVPTTTTVTLDPRLSSTLATAGGSGFLWPINTKEPPTSWIVESLGSAISNPTNYPGGIAPFYVGAMTSNYRFVQQKTFGAPVGRPVFSVTVDTVANTNDGAILKFYLQDNSAVTVCFSKASGCPAPSAKLVVVDLAGGDTIAEVSMRFSKALRDASIPGIDDVTAVSGGSSSVSIYLLSGPSPTKSPELFGNGGTTALCGAWSVTAITTSYASVIGTYEVAGRYTAPVSWNVDAVSNPTYIHTATQSPAWAVVYGDDSAVTHMSAATKGTAAVSQGAINPGDVMSVTASTAYGVGNSIVNITNTVSLNLDPDPTKGTTLSSITFTGFSGYTLDKQRLTLPTKANILHGQALTFWSLLGGLKKYAVQFTPLPADTFTLTPATIEASIDVRDGPNATTIASRLVNALDPLPGISASIGQQRIQVTCDNAALTTHALNFNLFGAATNQQFVVWMDKGGAAFVPPPGSIGVKVTLGDAVTATDVANTLVAAVNANPTFANAFRTARRGVDGVQFTQVVGGDVVGRARIVLTVDRADYDGSAAIGSNLIHLFSLSTEYVMCLKQLTADCPISTSATRVNIDCTNGTACDSAAKVAVLVQTAVNSFESVFSTVIVSTKLYITVNANGASTPSYVEWSSGSWGALNLVDVGQMPRTTSGGESNGGNSNQEGIFVGPTESISSWRYQQIRKGAPAVYVEQDVTQASASDAVTVGNAASVSVEASTYAGAAGFRLFGDGTTGRDNVSTPYVSDGRTVSNMFGVLEGFPASLASTSLNCRLWASSIDTSVQNGYGKPCNLGGAVSGTLRAASSPTSAPLKMYPPTVTFVASDQALVTWTVPESKGNTAANFTHGATTEVQYMRCDACVGGCEGAITCPETDGICPTAATSQWSTGVTLTNLKGDEAYYVFRVRTKYSTSDWGVLSDTAYARRL